MPAENSLNNLKMFSSDHQPKKNGRKPSHLKKYFKEHNIGTQDMRLLLGGIIPRYRTIDQIKEAVKDPKTPPLIIFILRAVLNDFSKGKIDTIQWLVHYGYGMPKIEIESKNDTVTTELSPEERKKRIDELLMKRNLQIQEDKNEKD